MKSAAGSRDPFISQMSAQQTATIVFQAFSTSEIFGNILHQLNVITNSTVLNTHDIPVVMRYVKNLSGTCQVLYNMIEEDVNFIATNMFLTSLSNKYNKSIETLATRFNTPPCKQWLFKFIEEKGFRNYYNSIQDIFKLVADVKGEVKGSRLNFHKDCYLGKEKYFSPRRLGRTKEGIVLEITTSPDSIRTPFGSIKIYKNYIKNNDLIERRFLGSISELFIKHMGACLYETSDCTEQFEIIETEDFGKIREINEKDLRTISKADADKRIGTKNLIVGEFFNHPVSYNITQVNGRPIPDVIEIKKGQKGYNEKLISRMWRLLESERLGLPFIKQETIKEPAIQVFPLFQNIAEAAIWGVGIAKKIWVEGEISNTGKSLTWKHNLRQAWDEINLMLELNNCAKPKLKDAAWSIVEMSKPGGRGGFWLSYQTNKPPCSLKKLKEAYALVIKEVSNNWEMSTLEKHSPVLKRQRKSEEDYQLFVKKNATETHVSLIHSLAKTMNLSDTISSFVHERINFFWIKKKNLTEVCKAFNIVISD